MAFTFVVCVWTWKWKMWKFVANYFHSEYRVTRKSAATARIMNWEPAKSKSFRRTCDTPNQKKRGKCENVCMSNLISKQIEGEQLRPAVATSLWHKSERIPGQDIRSTTICVCRTAFNDDKCDALPLEAASSATFSDDDKTFSVFKNHRRLTRTILKQGSGSLTLTGIRGLGYTTGTITNKARMRSTLGLRTRAKGASFPRTRCFRFCSAMITLISLPIHSLRAPSTFYYFKQFFIGPREFPNFVFCLSFLFMQNRVEISCTLLCACRQMPHRHRRFFQVQVSIAKAQFSSAQLWRQQKQQQIFAYLLLFFRSVVQLISAQCIAPVAIWNTLCLWTGI